MNAVSSGSSSIAKCHHLKPSITVKPDFSHNLIITAKKRGKNKMAWKLKYIGYIDACIPCSLNSCYIPVLY